MYFTQPIKKRAPLIFLLVVGLFCWLKPLHGMVELVAESESSQYSNPVRVFQIADQVGSDFAINESAHQMRISLFNVGNFDHSGLAWGKSCLFDLEPHSIPERVLHPKFLGYAELSISSYQSGLTDSNIHQIEVATDESLLVGFFHFVKRCLPVEFSKLRESDVFDPQLWTVGGIVARNVEAKRQHAVAKRYKGSNHHPPIPEPLWER